MAWGTLVLLQVLELPKSMGLTYLPKESRYSSPFPFHLFCLSDLCFLLPLHLFVKKKDEKKAWILPIFYYWLVTYRTKN